MRTVLRVLRGSGSRESLQVRRVDRDCSCVGGSASALDYWFFEVLVTSFLVLDLGKELGLLGKLYCHRIHVQTRLLWNTRLAQLHSEAHLLFVETWLANVPIQACFLVTAGSAPRAIRNLLVVGSRGVVGSGCARLVRLPVISSLHSSSRLAKVLERQDHLFVRDVVLLARVVEYWRMLSTTIVDRGASA